MKVIETAKIIAARIRFLEPPPVALVVAIDVPSITRRAAADARQRPA
jgi:hypothetical protein